MRTLAYHETHSVAGGLAEDDGSTDNVDIVVYGTRQFDHTIYTEHDGSFGEIDNLEDLLDPDMIPNDAAVGWLAIPVLTWVELALGAALTAIGWVLNEIFDDNERIEAERDIGNSFTESDPIRIENTIHGPLLLQSDGWYYFDADKNGKLDMRFKAGPNGSIIVDDGKGIHFIDVSIPLPSHELA